MKTKKLKTHPRAVRGTLRATRKFAHRSVYVFAAFVGLWLPKSYSAVLVDLDSTALPEGPLATWKNNGTTPGDFTSAGSIVPNVTNVLGVKGISFLASPGGTNGTHYIGPVAPAEVVRGNPRTIEAWVYNPTAQ